MSGVLPSVLLISLEDLDEFYTGHVNQKKVYFPRTAISMNVHLQWVLSFKRE